MLRKTTLARSLSLAFGATVLTVGMSSTVLAQSNTTGSISGRAASGTTLTIENKAFGLTRQTTVGSDGAFSVSSLPPGTYSVKAKLPNGKTQDQTITVTAGEGTSANFDVVSTIEVTGRVSRIDVKSPESTTVFSREKIDRIPVIRDVTAVALLAPGATEGDSRIGQTNVRGGNVPSLGGASPAENVYYINGFNVTNSLNGVAFNQVPFEAVGQQQVKTGGYSVEFGRSLGGVLSVTTKRGTNEWTGGVNAVYSPMSLSGGSVYTKKNATTGQWELVGRAGGTDDLKANVWIGGPIVENKLFFFGLIQGANIKRDTYGINRQEFLKSTTPTWLTKIDWNINDNNRVEFTAFTDKTKEKISNFTSAGNYTTVRGTSLGTDEYTTGGENLIAKYTTYLTEDLTVSAMYGLGKYNRKSQIPSLSCPFVRDDRLAARVNYGCWTQSVATDPNANDERTALRLDAEWVLGAHTLRFGMDNEDYKVVDGTIYPGGERYQIRTIRAGSRLSNGYVHAGETASYLEIRHFENGGSFKTKNSAFYLEDNWQISKNVVLNAGVRSESFNNLNSTGASFIKVDNTIAPRFGVTWDVKGDATTKVFGNAGRYYIPVMSNTNVRLAGTELDWREFWLWNGTFSADKFQIPGKGAQLGTRLITQDGSPKDPRTVVDPNIKPMFQDEFIVGMQQALTNRWTVGAKLTHRNLKSVMDDMCNDEGAGNWANANGYTAAQADAIAATVGHCFLYNPGKALTANVDFGDGKLTVVTIPATALGFPQPKRTYNALELGFERAWDGKWSIQGSYVLAFSKGNTEGYVKSDIGQDDAGISQDWDYPGLAEGAFGYLPNDRRHTLKVFGSYQVAPEWRVGANMVIQSGRPKNCFGYYAGNLDGVSIFYGAASFWCNRVLQPRGTLGRLDWTRDLSIQTTYTPSWKKGLTFQADFLNILNNRGIRGIQEQGETSIGTASPAYGEPINVQKARTVRLTAQYEF